MTCWHHANIVNSAGLWLVRYSIYNPYKSSPVDEPQRAERERADIHSRPAEGSERERESRYP